MTDIFRVVRIVAVVEAGQRVEAQGNQKPRLAHDVTLFWAPPD
jgi:hypothetical protein